MLIDDNEDNKDVERHGYIRQMIIGVRLGLLLAPTGALREDLKRKSTFSFGHCPKRGGVYPCSNFLALFSLS